MEIVDDLHELVAENKKLKREIEYLRSEMSYVLKKLKEFKPTLEVCIEALDVGDKDEVYRTLNRH
jgi:prefoldin subunit 5